MSLWGYADRQAYAEVVSEGTQQAVEMEDVEVTPMRLRASRMTYEGVLPGDMAYYLRVMRQRVSLVMVRDPWEQLQLMTALARERMAMAQVLAMEGESNMAVKTANKAQMYLEKGTLLWQSMGQGYVKVEEMADELYKAGEYQAYGLGVVEAHVNDLASGEVQELYRDWLSWRDSRLQRG